jgi:hypothetical protein
VTRRHTIAATVGAGLALADASVVVLALPPILTEFDASVEAVAAVIGAYTLALAAALPIIIRHRRGRHAGRFAMLGMLGFALASAACGLTGAMAPLIALRTTQGGLRRRSARRRLRAAERRPARRLAPARVAQCRRRRRGDRAGAGRRAHRTA